jgi:putative tricarboxylic transport membrane protein
MITKQRDYLCALLFFVIGLIMFIEAKDIHPTITGNTLEVGSGYVPRVLALTMMGTAVVLVILTLIEQRKKRPHSVVLEKKESRDFKGGILTIGLLILYALLFDPLGFLLSSAIYLFLQILVLSNKKNKNIVLFAIVSIITPVFIYSLFLYGFSLPLPYGILYF